MVKRTAQWNALPSERGASWRTPPAGAGSPKWAVRRLLAAFVWLASFGLSALLLPTTALASPFDITGTDWEGCAEFIRLARKELGDARIVATEQIDLSRLKPEDSLILLHPEKSMDTGSLARFMRAGGRVVLLDDYGRGDALLRHFGMDRIPMPRHPADSVRGDPALPIAEPASSHPVVSDARRVVLNHPTGLHHPDLSPVLKVRGVGEPDVLVAVAGAVGQGRLLAVGDPSTVMNSMLRYPGNRAFARAIVRYAGDDDSWGKRQGRVFVASGRFTENGSFGNEASIFSDMGSHIRGLEDSLSSVRREGFPGWAAYLVAVVVGLGVVIWVGAHAGRVHKPVHPRFTRPIPMSAQGGVAGRAAVLAAPNTSRGLALLELKAAFEEELCALLDLEKKPAQDILLERLAEEKWLDPPDIADLRRLLLRMAEVETLVLSRSAAALSKMSDDEVMAASKTIRNLLARVRRNQSESAH
jgi:hypothetical protein